MLSIKNISFSYNDKKIITDFSLNINKGDKICFFGESGCGKTTLLRLISGLEKPQEGSIIYNECYNFSIVFQENLLLPFKNIIDNITLFGASEENAIQNLKALGLRDVLHKMPDELSGGMQRRVALARALSNDFNILILDEPFNGLDDENIENSTKHILSISQDRPIILVSHSVKEAELLGTKIIRL